MLEEDSGLSPAVQIHNERKLSDSSKYIRGNNSLLGSNSIGALEWREIDRLDCTKGFETALKEHRITIFPLETHTHDESERESNLDKSHMGAVETFISCNEPIMKWR